MCLFLTYFFTFLIHEFLKKDKIKYEAHSVALHITF